jgi:hypothetical protein
LAEREAARRTRRTRRKRGKIRNAHYNPRNIES